MRDALLQAAERVLERDGLAGLTLRAVAREAGVSHAAPTHHFGDLTGLVSELAAIGFRQFNATLEAARATGTVPLERSMAGAKAYVGYAQAHPGMYGLMFRTERLDMSRPSLCEAANASFAGLAGAVGASRHEHISEQALSLEQAAAIARAWSLVHGFTTLLLDGRLADILRRLPEAPRGNPAGNDAEDDRWAGKPGLRVQCRANATATPVSPITFTSSVPHLKSRANWSAALRASSLALALAFTSI